ncbi:MAG TPA: glycosyltransferase, partial [Verrucomicrobiae bacterium]|nr:glycosyltransferase [Verrucomicrobiae bacterium]
MTETPPLWVVMPVYNEATAIAEVINEWVTVLRTTASSFAFLVINDGSTDGTQTILENLSWSELLVIHRPNSGHGSSCLFGYRKAVEQGATWIFQIDSDGQCDPRFFEAFWRWRLK